MKSLLIIMFLLIFQSCQAQNYDEKIKAVFETKDINKIEKLLDQYYQINGTDFLFEKSSIELFILKKDFKKVFKLYKNTNYIEIKKDKKILTEISQFIIASNKKLKPVKRLKYYKQSLKAFPYSAEIYNEYISTLLSLDKVEEALKLYLKFDEIFNKNNKYLNKILVSKLKSIYLKEKDIRIFKLLVKMKDTTEFIEKEVKKSNKLLLSIDKLPKNFNTQILKDIIPNLDYSLSKYAIKFFILLENKENLKPYIKKLYKASSKGVKIFIYKHFYDRFNEEIDKNLIAKLLKSTNHFEVKVAVELIQAKKINKYTKKLKLMLGKEKHFNLNKLYILKSLNLFNSSYVKEFVLNKNTMKSQKIENQIKKQELISVLGIENDTDLLTKVLKNKDIKESFKAIALNILLINKKDISFFNEYDNFIYYLIFLKNTSFIDAKLMKKIAILAYKNWNDSRMLLKYLKTLSLKEIDKLYSSEKFKSLKNTYYLELIYYSITLEENREKFKEFILKKRFLKEEYIELFQFSKKDVATLLKLYIVDDRENIKVKILEKLVKTLEH